MNLGDNLLLDDSGNMKLSDFGLAVELYINSRCQTETLKAPTDCFGTPLFTAPEVLRNFTGLSRINYSRPADIW